MEISSFQQITSKEQEVRKLINDLIQYSDAPELLKSPALAEYYEFTDLTITLKEASTIDCVGIGLFDASSLTVTLNGETEIIAFSAESRGNGNGLYMLSKTYTDITTIRLEHSGSLMGRFAAGKSRFFGCSKSREPGLYSTYEPRKTASGQVIPGAGGISGRGIGLDFRYVIDEDAYQDFYDAFDSQIARGFPFFLYFDKETHRMPYTRLYGQTDNQLLFQSATNFFKYSKRFEYMESF